MDGNTTQVNALTKKTATIRALFELSKYVSALPLVLLCHLHCDLIALKQPGGDNDGEISM